MTTAIDAHDREATLTSSGRSFDDLLGVPETRYFATGYKRVRYRAGFGAPSIGDYGRTTFDGLGSADYPSDWSLNPGGTPRAAHLSSVDSLVLGIAAIEHALTEIPGIIDMPKAVIDNVSIRSGSRPRTNLSNVPVTAALTPVESGVFAELGVGGFRITAHLRETDAPRRREGDLRPYWDGYRRNTVLSELMTVDLPGKSVLTSHIACIPPAVSASGIESALWPGLTHIDNVALFGQIAQVLVQTTDGVVRGSIDNLWMRRMAFTRVANTKSTRFQAQARIVEHSVIERSGRQMHSLEMEAVSDHGIEASALFGFVVHVREHQWPATGG